MSVMKIRHVISIALAAAISGTLEFTDITVDAGTGSVTVRALFP
jgi:hypothetical protein